MILFMVQRKERKQIKMERELIRLSPVCTHNVWGGERLRTEFGYDQEGNDLGECWGISANKVADATVKNGVYAGWKLSELYEKHRELFGNYKQDTFPLLTKIIDARQDLSIQVHPSDAYAKVHENGSLGKMECWYIMDCPENANLVIGHNARTKEELRKMVDGKEWNALMRTIPVKKGDFIQIDPGCVHAIKAGFLILETQQNSDITYRLYDYDRLSNGKLRELHIEKSLDVITVPAKDMRETLKSTIDQEKDSVLLLYKCEYYTIYKAKVEEEVIMDELLPFTLGSVIEGEGMLWEETLKKGDHFIVPSGYGKMKLHGNMTLILSAPNPKQ